MISELVTARHLSRKAVVYVRQSHPHQVLGNQESLRLQYGLCQRARDLGWQEADVEVVDADLGLSGAAADHRRGFKDLIARVTLGEIGIILSYDVTRLARNCSDWYPLLDLCGFRQCLIADRDGVYDPGSANGRLLLGLKGTISEVELHTMRGRLTAGLLSKAERGELALHLPAGLTRDAGGAVVKDPDREVQDRITLVFTSFLEQGSVGKVMRTFTARGLSVPRGNRFSEATWRPATLDRITRILRNPAYAGAFVYGRTRSCHALYPNGRLITTRCPMAEWKIVVKDRYPAYIDWVRPELLIYNQLDINGARSDKERSASQREDPIHLGAATRRCEGEIRRAKRRGQWAETWEPRSGSALAGIGRLSASERPLKSVM